MSWSEENSILSTAGKGVNLWSIYNMGTPINSAKLAPKELTTTLAWCTFSSKLFATGGTNIDTNIKIWDCNTCKQVHTIPNYTITRSLLWNTRHKELIVGNDSAKYHVTFISTPQYEREAEIIDNDLKILNLCLNPTSTELLASTSTETLWFWRIEEECKKKKAASSSVIAMAFPR